MKDEFQSQFLCICLEEQSPQQLLLRGINYIIKGVESELKTISQEVFLLGTCIDANHRGLFCQSQDTIEQSRVSVTEMLDSYLNTIVMHTQGAGSTALL